MYKVFLLAVLAITGFFAKSILHLEVLPFLVCQAENEKEIKAALTVPFNTVEESHTERGGKRLKATFCSSYAETC